MKLITGLAAAAVTGLTVLFLESERELHTFRVKRYLLHLPGLSKGRILFVTDYHEAVNGKMNARILERAGGLKPDLILVGGDMVNGRRPDENTYAALNLMNGLAGIAPVYYAMGNHECRLRNNSKNEGYDWEGYRNALDPSIRFLENARMTVSLRGNPLVLYGLNVDRPFYVRNGEKLTEEIIVRHIGRKDPEVPGILLAHDPSWFSAYAEWKADLTLSGHYHGGVARVPVLGGVVNPKMELFPKYDYGLFEDGESKMIVGAGLGQHTLPVRWCNLPELVVIDLE